MSVSFPPGLGAVEVAQRQALEGANELATDQHRSLWHILAEVGREPMFLLLLGAGAIYLAMGDTHEALILLGFVLIIIAVTTLQEWRTERALTALRDLSSPRALVIRSGQPQRIPGREVVREDILILAEGDRVPADALVLQAHELALDESLLTGESAAMSKFAPGVVSSNGDEAATSAHQVFAGTVVVRGQGIVCVTAIGSQTELGRIGLALRDITLESSPLQEEIGRLTKKLALIGVTLCLLLTILYVVFRGGWLAGLLAGITLAMSILPQEFPVIMIVFLAFGARRIAAQRVLTRRLHAIETLGETTVLCVDKTGTLTENRMSIAALVVDGAWLDVSTLQQAGTDLPEPYHALMEYAVLASEIAPHDPMEQAFHRFSREFLANTEHLHPDWALVREYELSPELPAMSHLWRGEEEVPHVVAAKGAPEAIFDLCHLRAEQIAALTQQTERMADQGLRVLAVAHASHSGTEWPTHQHAFEFVFVGLVGLADPLRAEVPAAVAECQRAGIRVVMITGDHPRTARAIALQAGIDHGSVVLGSELEGLSTAALAAHIQNGCVFARVTPQQKLAIVEALKAAGEVVAMTGDGVNDAPALKAAHIGIAMGKRGTDVAREAAALVLLEDDFGAIVEAVRLGRRIFANLRQALVFALAVHIPIIVLATLPLLLGLPLVLAPMHIAFLELVIDPACSIVFEAEAGSAQLMAQAPRAQGEPLIGRRHIMFSLLQGTLASAVVGLVYWFALKLEVVDTAAKALAFITLVTASMAMILSNRSPHVGLLKLGRGLPAVSLWVLLGIFAGLLAVTTNTTLAAVFSFSVPSLSAWLAAFVAGGLTLLLFEGLKRFTSVSAAGWQTPHRL